MPARSPGRDSSEAADVTAAPSAEPAGSLSRVEVPGSQRLSPAGPAAAEPVDPEEPIEVSVLVRPRKPLSAEAVLRGDRVDRDDFAAEYGADERDLDAVRRFAERAGLEVRAVDPVRRTVVVAGTAATLARAFGTELRYDDFPAGRVRGRTGGLYVPTGLGDIVQGVFGLDNRRQARPHVVADLTVEVDDALNGRPGTFTPLDLATLYDFPPGDGSTVTIGIVEFGGGFIDADLDAYFAALGVARPSVTAVSVDGVGNMPTPPDAQGDTPDAEVMLDIEVAGAIAPAAHVVVYFAPFTERGWVDVLTTAVHDSTNKPSVLSISWGFTEGFDLWTPQALAVVNNAFKEAAALGVTVFCASGDDGSADEQPDGHVHVDFPASSPFVTAVGGTSLTAWAMGTEKVWKNGRRATGGGASGGGVSKVFDKLAYKTPVVVPPRPGTVQHGRGVPDVAADADPNSGYRIGVRGQNGVAGGTSASAPLWAGLVARVNQQVHPTVGFFNPALYQQLRLGHALRDITVGTNDTTGHLGGYSAHVGWDARPDSGFRSARRSSRH